MPKINPIAPLQTGFHRTLDQWPEYTAEQKSAICLANIVTVARLLLRAGIETAYSTGQITRNQYAYGNSVIDTLDKLDGKLIRDNDAENDWGKVFDPFVDKLDFFMQELIMLCRGEIDPVTFLIRFLRDVASTMLRTDAADSTEKDAGANIWGQASTTIRSVSLRINNRYPDTKIAKVSKHVATAALLASLGRNWWESKK